jgi:hypothetical protein
MNDVANRTNVQTNYDRGMGLRLAFNADNPENVARLDEGKGIAMLGGHGESPSGCGRRSSLEIGNQMCDSAVRVETPISRWKHRESYSGSGEFALAWPGFYFGPSRAIGYLP